MDLSLFLFAKYIMLHYIILHTDINIFIYTGKKVLMPCLNFLYSGFDTPGKFSSNE